MKLYESIEDFPVYNWFKCIETKDYSCCLMNVKQYKPTLLVKCEEQFNKLYLEFIDTFGISKDLREIIELQKQILALKIELKLGKRTAQTFLTIKELELDEKMETEKPKTNLHKVAIEKYLGFRLNLKEVTVKEYYNYLEAIKTDNGRATN
jgi:hypothetical protein